jgi:sugar lactone lactonase YvrE
MAFGPGGALYFADSGNKRVRRVALDGTISTVVGAPGRWSGAPTSGERALQAQLSSPADVAFGPDGHLYVADTGDNEVLRLGPGNRLTVIAGDAHLHYAGVYNMGMPATKASPDGPAGLAFDPTGDLFIFGLNTKALLVMDSHGVIHAVVGERPGTGFYPHSSGGMVTAPDGQVLSLDGTSLDRITSTAVRPVVNFTTNEVTRDWKGFLPNGVAVLGDGGIYVDTDGSNGYTRVPGIVEVGERGKGAVIWKG